MSPSVHLKDDRHTGRDIGNGHGRQGDHRPAYDGSSAKSPNTGKVVPEMHVRNAEVHKSSTGGLGGVQLHRVVMTEPTDEFLLDQYRKGDRPSFKLLVGRYQRELFHFLVRFIGDRAAAEDIFQETFLQVHQSAEGFDVSRRFRPWLFTIAANKARDLMRSQSRRPVSPLQASINPNDESRGEFIDLLQSSGETPATAMERQEQQQLVQRCVMGMPDHLREILILSYFHQFPYKQIGDILGIPLGTVKSRLHSAVAIFADRWRGSNPDTSLS